MPPISRRRLESIAGIALAGVLFVAVVLLADVVLRDYRLDLTADRLYSISADTGEVLDEIREPITLTLYFSHGAAEGVPYVREYARRVEELLHAYASRSNGRIRLRTVDPRPLTDDRERAESLGLEPVPTGDGREIFLGLVGTNAVDGLEVIPFLEPERERFLEYDVTRLVWSLNHPERPVVGLLSRIPLTERVDPATGEVHPDRAVIDRVREVVELRTISHPVHRVDDDIDLLWVVHPRHYDERTWYAIDQFVMRGGRLVMMVDPVADSDSGREERDGEVRTRISRSETGPLFDAWGIEVDFEHALADPRRGMVVSAGEGERGLVHPGLIGIDRDGLASDDVITAMLERVVFGSPGSIRVDDDIRLTPLVRTAESAAPLPAGNFVAFANPAEIVRGYQPDGNRHVVAARLEGGFRSAYPDGPPERSRAPASEHRTASDSVQMVVFADTDLLTDGLWVRTRPTRDGRMLRSAWSGNGDLIANTLENMAGSDALIRIRAQGTSARPFTRVRELEREAADRYRETEQELRAALRGIEERLDELRAGRGEEAGTAILSDAERVELEQARQLRAELRAELRAVRQRLDADIDALGTRLKLLNIVVVPLVVAGAAIAVFVLRRRRRRRRA